MLFKILNGQYGRNNYQSIWAATQPIRRSLALTLHQWPRPQSQSLFLCRHHQLRVPHTAVQFTLSHQCRVPRSLGILTYTQPITISGLGDPHHQTYSFKEGQNSHYQTPREAWTKENKNETQWKPSWSSVAFSEKRWHLSKDKPVSEWVLAFVAVSSHHLGQATSLHQASMFTSVK